MSWQGLSQLKSQSFGFGCPTGFQSLFLFGHYRAVVREVGKNPDVITFLSEESLIDASTKSKPVSGKSVSEEKKPCCKKSIHLPRADRGAAFKSTNAPCMQRVFSVVSCGPQSCRIVICFLSVSRKQRRSSLHRGNLDNLHRYVSPEKSHSQMNARSRGARL